MNDMLDAGSMTPPPLAITVQDTYHRAKRAALTFSSLLVLAAATAADPSVSGFQVHLPILRLGLWFAAGYHVWLFHYEFKAMVRLNSQFNASSPTRDFTETLSSVEQAIREAQFKIGSASEHLSRPTELPTKNLAPPHIDQQLAVIVKELRDKVAALDAGHAEGSQQTRFENMLALLEQFSADYRSNYENIVRAYLDDYQRAYRQQTELMEGGSSSAMDAANAIKQLVSDINSLADNISNEQRIIANRFDRLAVNALFALATGAALILPWMLDRCLLPGNFFCFS